MIMNECQLRERLDSMNHYFFFDRGDLFSHFYDGCGDVLEKQSCHDGPLTVPEVPDPKVEEAKEHVRFCCEVYRLQSSQGRYWLHESPWTTKSRRMKEFEKLNRDQGRSQSSISSTGWKYT